MYQTEIVGSCRFIVQIALKCHHLENVEKVQDKDKYHNLTMNKRQKCKHGETNAIETEDNNPPAYGTQEYWEKRYEKCNEDRSAGPQTATKEEDANDESPEPEHEWYFTYEELQPLILPLILGRDDDDEEEEWSDVEEMIEIIDEDTSKENEDTEETDQESVINLESKIEDDQYGEEQHEDIENTAEDSKVAVQADLPPKRILEIGCGDVPLGIGIYNEISTLQPDDNISTIESITCIDYSKSVIDMLREQQQEKRHSKLESTGTTQKTQQIYGSSDTKMVYEVQDARKLPYKNSYFHLIIDKGTLDAMLSDKDAGKANCIKIVSEASRVLAQDGYLVIVSHLNANNEVGMSWIDEVVVVGLKAGDAVSNWRIEVHSGENDDDDESEGQATATSISIQDEQIEGTLAKDDQAEENTSGPAVYIIRKLNKDIDATENEDKQSIENQQDSKVEVKFFGY